MADYKEMYLIMARASEQAIRILIDAQQKCEDLYVDESDSPIDFLKLISTDQENGRLE